MTRETHLTAPPAVAPDARVRDIHVRRPEIPLSEEVPRYWFDGDPFKTHFFNALSSVFPDGEAFFVRAVLHYKDRVTDPELLQAIRDFAGQEGAHAHQHDRHVQMLVDQGYHGIAKRNELAKKMMPWFNRKLPKESLAATASLEHLTAMLARRLLSRPEITTDPMDERMQVLWRWHALEEAEHKAVAYDVLQLVSPSRGYRVWALLNNTLGLVVETLDRMSIMLRRDGLMWNRKIWADGLRWLFGKGGLLRGMGADYRSYFREGFHPDDVDDRPLITAERTALEQRAA